MYEITKEITVETFVGIDADGETISKTETLEVGETFDDDDVISKDENRYEVQWGNGDVSYIPTEVVKVIA